MIFDYQITEEEYKEREDLEPLYCSDTCGSFDSLNQCCWITWWRKNEGNLCDFPVYVDHDMNYVWVKFKSKPQELESETS